MELQTFNFKTQEVRTAIKNNEPWFVGKDVADILGYSNTRDALNRHVDNEDKADVVIHDGRQNRNMIGVNESGLYALIFGSKLEKAKEFKRWVNLPANAKLWKIYHPKGPYTSGSEIHNLTPSAYGGLDYEIKGNPAPHVYLIDTGVKGRVAIYAGPETGAVIS